MSTLPEIRRRPFPTRLKARPEKVWMAKMVYWYSGLTENVIFLADEIRRGPGRLGGTDSLTIRRTARMLRIVDLCMTGLACGTVGPILPVDRRSKRCMPPIRKQPTRH